MPTLKEIKGRIASVRSTLKITSAMKLVSSAKLRKAQKAIESMRPYEQQLQEILSSLVTGGLFLLLIDTVARTATALEIPLSILTGVIGAPIYAWLLWKQKAKVT